MFWHVEVLWIVVTLTCVVGILCACGLFQELIRNTDRGHSEGKSLERALEEMLVLTVINVICVMQDQVATNVL